MDRIRRLVMQVLEKHKEEFTTDFAENKKTLDQIAVIRSKGLKNELAGYITKYIRRESESRAQKQQREARAAAEAQAQAQESVEEDATQEPVLEDAGEEVEQEEDVEQDDSEQEEIVMENKPQE